MECMGRMTGIFLCVICLTLVPAGHMLADVEKQKANVLEMQAERFYAGMRQGRRITREAYGQFEDMVKEYCPDGSIELMLARRYVMPVQEGGSSGIPMRILYREDVEGLLLKEGEIVLDETVFISIRLYGKNGLSYCCGGGIW